jgi:hypothetical protein
LPGCRSLNTYTPELFVEAVFATPVSALASFTVAFGIGAPVGSTTFPVSDPNNPWPAASGANTRTAKSEKMAHVVVFCTNMENPPEFV